MGAGRSDLWSCLPASIFLFSHLSNSCRCAENKEKLEDFSRNLSECSCRAVTTPTCSSQARFVVSVLLKTTSSHFSQPYSDLASMKTSEGAGELRQLPDLKTVQRAALQADLSWPGSDFCSFQVLKIFAAGRCSGWVRQRNSSKLLPAQPWSPNLAQGWPKCPHPNFSSGLLQPWLSGVDTAPVPCSGVGFSPTFPLSVLQEAVAELC